MNQGEPSAGNQDALEKLQHRIDCLVDIQETVQAALTEFCTLQERTMLEGALHRQGVREEQLRQELAALK
jgi:hypothetical protein